MADHLDFDPQLPELWAVLDPAEVARRFEAWWPATGVRVAVGRAQDVKYQPSMRCVAAYDLVIEVPGGETVPTIGVVDIGPAGVALRLYTDDPTLPWLPLALDAERMRGHVRLVPGWEHAADVVVTPIRYKPGARCMFRIDAHTGSGWSRLFGKMLAEGGDQLMSALTALDATAREGDGGLRISPPLAYWPEFHMVIQAAVPGGIEFHRVVFDGAAGENDRLAWMAEAGRSIASLHQVDHVPGPRRLFREDVAELESYGPAIERAAPRTGRSYAQTVALLRSAEPPDGPPPVASHGAFRTDQFLMDRGHLVMVDLDTFCWSNPGRDIGNFLAYLAWRAIRRPDQAEFIDRAGPCFLQGYEEARTPPPQRWIDICTAQSLLKIAGRRFRSLTVKEWPAVPALVDRAQRLIAA